MATSRSNNPPVIDDLPIDLNAEVTRLRSLNRRLTHALYCAAITVPVTLVFALGALFVRPTPERFAVDPSGRFAPIVALNKDDPPDARVISRMGDCITDLYNHSFTNYRTTVSKAKVECLTGGGADSFQEALNPLLEVMQRSKVNMVATLRVSPNIASRSFINGARSFKVQAMVDLGYVGQSGTQQPVSYALEMTMVRVPWESHLTGLRVRDILLKRADGVAI